MKRYECRDSLGNFIGGTNDPDSQACGPLGSRPLVPNTRDLGSCSSILSDLAGSEDPYYSFMPAGTQNFVLDDAGQLGISETAGGFGYEQDGDRVWFTREQAKAISDWCAQYVDEPYFYGCNIIINDGGSAVSMHAWMGEGFSPRHIYQVTPDFPGRQYKYVWSFESVPDQEYVDDPSVIIEEDSGGGGGPIG